MRRVEHVMGMPISLDIREHVPDGGQVVFDWLAEVDRRFSPFRPDSEVRLGLRSPEMAEIERLCAEYELRSGGAFRARLPGRPFDPSGIVKGWAVQRAADLLRAQGVRSFCLNAGGDVAAAGRVWSVGIRHPERADQVCAVLAVRDQAVATSGCYERGEHIYDGRTGEPVRELTSLTVVAADLTTADAVSTAAFAMGAAGAGWAAGQPGCLVFAVGADRRVRRSPGLDDLMVQTST
ncbi:FAD:protein FMN transferase [Amycolatopsis alkalitolerans]|uniref:FAD:protein FMN transferase n=1 Tax=Amycolatopsis alkalitolerans TaxID=2547244 RepID=A0A5C4LXI3_9PSEU|nr:FAD:protein FMN transferase [Amycolatopsis alkalitolerans]TNC23531.1 FAD:protein FMN transferase [Amycolatopsis alkalitolerans]